MKIVAITRMRMGSARLLKRAMMDLLRWPVLIRDADRLQRLKSPDEVVIITTTLPVDDQTLSLCEDQGWLYSRRVKNTVLDRYYRRPKVGGIGHRPGGNMIDYDDTEREVLVNWK